MRRTKTEGRAATKLYQDLASQDADFQVRRSPRFVSQHRPDYIAAATAVREREKNTLVAPPQQPQFRPKESLGRLKDLSQWYNPSRPSDDDEEDAKPSRDENENPEETELSVRERFKQSRSRFHDLRDSASKSRLTAVCPPSPSLAKTSVKRRLAAARQKFVSAVNSGFPPAPRFGGSSSEAEDEREVANSDGKNENRQHDKENRYDSRDETEAFFSSPASAARKKTFAESGRNPSTQRRAGATPKKISASPAAHRVSFSKIVEFDVPVKGGDGEEEDEGDSDFTYRPSDEEEDDEDEEFGQGSCPKYDFDLIPDHLRDNPDILLEHRAYYSTWQCLRSVLSFHNDTGNIWIRLLSGGAFANLAYNTITTPPSYHWSQGNVIYMPFQDQLFLGGYAGAVAFSFLCSALFHVFRPHRSYNVFYWSSILEYSSTNVLLFGFSASVLHFFAYCYPNLHNAYIAASAAISIFGFLTPWTNSRAFRKIQSELHSIVVGVLCLIVGHAWYTLGYQQTVHLIYDAWWAMAAVGCYAVGRWFYEGRRPESWFPGKFDTFMSSTQLVQVAQTLSAYCFWQIILQLAETRIKNSSHVCPIGNTHASQANQYVGDFLERFGQY